MKSILSTLSHKWPEYLLEILVITIGILGAFALNNWNEQQKTDKQESYLIQQLYKELKQDSLQLISYIDISHNHFQGATYLLDNLDNPSPNMDSVINHVFFSGRFLWFESNSPTYDEMVSSGQLGILKDDSLKYLLTRYYDLFDKYQSFQFYESQRNKAAYNTHKNKYFDLSIMAELWKNRRVQTNAQISNYLQDWEGFRLDPDTPLHLRNSRGVTRELIELYKIAHLYRLRQVMTFIQKSQK